jgi:hypothetical protein
MAPLRPRGRDDGRPRRRRLTVRSRKVLTSISCVLSRPENLAQARHRSKQKGEGNERYGIEYRIPANGEQNTLTTPRLVRVVGAALPPPPTSPNRTLPTAARRGPINASKSSLGYERRSGECGCTPRTLVSRSFVRASCQSPGQRAKSCSQERWPPRPADLRAARRR